MAGPLFGGFTGLEGNIGCHLLGGGGGGGGALPPKLEPPPAPTPLRFDWSVKTLNSGRKEGILHVESLIYGARPYNHVPLILHACMGTQLLSNRFAQAL